MRTKSKFVIFLIIFLFSACKNQSTIITPQPSITPLGLSPTSTPNAATFTPSPTEQPTSTPLPTSASFPYYPTKHILAEYGVTGNHSLFDIVIIEDDFQWILYSDGQFIADTPSGLKERYLSRHEICSLFNNLSRMGFYDIETNYQQDPTDPLYSFGDKYERIYDDLYYYLFVNGDNSRTLGAIDSYRGFLIPKMKKLLRFVETYSPNNREPYKPNRILVMFDKYVDYGYQTTYRSLPDDLSPPKSMNDIIYFEGSKAAEIYNALYHPPSANMVYTRDDKKYYIYYRVIFPHETIVPGWQPHNDPRRQIQNPYNNCK